MIIKQMFNGLALLALLVSLAACTTSPAPQGGADASGGLSVVTTIFAPYDFARAVTGGAADLRMLLPPASESHTYEPTPQDIIRIRECDVFIYVGGESDGWVETVLASVDADSVRIITLMDCVEALEEEIVDGMEDDGGDGDGHDDDDDEPEYDEHVWTSPRNAKLIVQRISDVICEADPANADAYRQNTDAYLAELDSLDAAFQDAVDAGVRKTLVFGDRFPFRYLTEAYGLEYSAAFPGCSVNNEASAATVKFLIQRIQDGDIPVVLHIELSNQKMAQTISEETGAEVRLLHAVHNISSQDFTSGVTYLDLMRRNADVLREALG